jgi:lipid-binding SYLF domain-containing protein
LHLQQWLSTPLFYVIDPGQGLDKIIPSSILEKAQGLAIYTVLKAGFLFSGRAGSGLVIARYKKRYFNE